MSSNLTNYVSLPQFLNISLKLEIDSPSSDPSLSTPPYLPLLLSPSFSLHPSLPSIPHLPRNLCLALLNASPGTPLHNSHPYLQITVAFDTAEVLQIHFRRNSLDNSMHSSTQSMNLHRVQLNKFLSVHHSLNPHYPHYPRGMVNNHPLVQARKEGTYLPSTLSVSSHYHPNCRSLRAIAPHSSIHPFIHSSTPSPSCNHRSISLQEEHESCYMMDNCDRPSECGSLWNLRTI